MIYFRENFKDLALELVNQKGNVDDIKANDNETKRKSDIESIKDCLITDAFGILASVLIKHKKIETIKEFIKSVD